MRILHLSNTPLSNSPGNLCQIQKEAGHDAKLLMNRKSNLNKVHVGGTLWNELDKAELVETFEKADVIHFHNFAWEQDVFKSLLGHELKEIALKKPCFIQYHSPRYSSENFEPTITDSFFDGRKGIIAQYHVRQYPECEYVIPNVLPIFDDRYMPIEKKWALTYKMTVTFSPSNAILKGWDNKGYDRVRDVFQKLRHHIDDEIIIHNPYEQCLLKKRWTHIGLEELMTGSYHLSFLEYMSAGACTLGHLDLQTKDAMARVVGREAVNTLPYIETRIDELERVLMKLSHEPQQVRDYAFLSRQWMINHWNPKTFVKLFDDIYSKL